MLGLSGQSSQRSDTYSRTNSVNNGKVDKGRVCVDCVVTSSILDVSLLHLSVHMDASTGFTQQGGQHRSDFLVHLHRSQYNIVCGVETHNHDKSPWVLRVGREHSITRPLRQFFS